MLARYLTGNSGRNKLKSKQSRHYLACLSHPVLEGVSPESPLVKA